MENKISFDPDEELIAFAEDFSKTFQDANDGEYFSSGDKYKILFQEDFDDKRGFKTIIRIGNHSKVIQLRRKDILTYSSDYVFYIILWLKCVENNQDAFNNSIWEIDSFVMDICVRLGKNKKYISEDILSYLNKYCPKSINRIKPLLAS